MTDFEVWGRIGEDLTLLKGKLKTKIAVCIVIYTPVKSKREDVTL